MSWHSRTSRISVCLAALTAIFAAARASGADGAGEMKKEQAIRVIQDPHTGMRWLLERTPNNPGGPGRMVLLPHGQTVLPNGQTAEEASVDSGSGRGRGKTIARSIIRAGDLLVVEEHSEVVDARLEAVAMGSAGKGASFNVRLSIGGKVVRAIAVGPGHAVLAPSGGFQ